MENFPDNFEESNGIELLQKCTKLEDVEHVLHEKHKINYRYTKDQLLKLRTHPLSTKSPTLCDNLKFLCGKNATKLKEKDEFDPKKAPLKKHGVTRPFEQVNEKLDSKNNEKLTVTFRTDKIDERKVTDPASRLRKEQDICLSPQRKSFNTGCYVPNAKNETIVINNSANKQILESNVNQNRENREVKENRNSREVPRRIGSGRIITSDPQSVIRGYPEGRQIPKEKPTVVFKCTFQGKSNDKEKDGFWDRSKNNYYDKRRYQYSDNHHDGDDSRERVWDQQRNNNFFERRKNYDSEYRREHEEEKEPEWMKDGPGSKNDMIELKGFDENVENFFRRGRFNNKSNSRVFQKTEGNRSPHSTTERSMVNGKDQSKRNSESDNSSVASESTLTAVQEPVVDTNPDEKSKIVDCANTEKKSTDVNIVKQPETHSIEINLDDIFKEPLPDISVNSDANESAGSKFTRWFKRDDVGTTTNSVAEPSSRVSSGLSGSFNPPINSTPNMKSLVSITSSNTLPGETSMTVPASNLLDLLRGSQENSATAPKQDVRTLVTGKLHSLEEIEAKLRGTDANKQASLNAVDKKKKEEETEAFKKLLSQAVKPNDLVKRPGENNANDSGFDSQKTKSENLPNFRAKSDLNSLLCNGDTHSSFPPNMLPPQVSRMSPMTVGKQFQLQQNKQQQEMLSKMLISSTGNYTIPPPTGVRPMNSPMTPGTFSQISPEIQSRINDCPITREMMQRPETMNILRALRNGDFTVHQLIEQYKKTTPSNQKFRESVICVLKIIQNSPYANSTPFMGSPVGIAFNVPPPSHSSQPPFSENIIQQMMMNSQYRSGIPNIVYQRDFSAQNQNMYQSNINKKHPTEQQQNVNQSSARMNSPITINAASVPNAIGNSCMSGSNSISSSRENKSVAGVTLKSSPASQSHSFTPLSVLRKLSAEKENLDSTFTKDSKESKTGDMSAAYSQSNAINFQHTIVSSGYASPISSTHAWNSAKSVTGTQNQKLSSNHSQLQQLQMRSISTQIAQGHDTYSVSHMNRLLSDGSTSICGNQSVSVRNSFVNGLVSTGDEQLNRLFSVSNVNSSFPLSAANTSMSVQNIMSLEEIERIQQSVRN